MCQLRPVTKCRAAGRAAAMLVGSQWNTSLRKSVCHIALLHVLQFLHGVILEPYDLFTVIIDWFGCEVILHADR